IQFKQRNQAATAETPTADKRATPATASGPTAHRAGDKTRSLAQAEPRSALQRTKGRAVPQSCSAQAECSPAQAPRRPPPPEDRRADRWDRPPTASSCLRPRNRVDTTTRSP